MTQLQQIDLTEKDFVLMIEGLEALPRLNDSSELFGDLMSAMILDNKDKEVKEKFSKERDKRNADKKAEMQEKYEDIKILQGKLLLLKRYLKQEGALKEANDIITR